MAWWPLIGIAVLVLGLVLRINTLLAVLLAALASGIAGGLGLTGTLAALGKAFNDNRYVTLVWIVLPVIGLLERYGLQQRARMLIADLRGATVARLLIAYLALRQGLAALGLTSVAGHAQTVRPLVAPMAEAAAERDGGPIDPPTRERIRAFAAATDNVGLFFGEDIFLAIASILLIKGFLEQNGIIVTPFQLSVWAIPVAIAAFLIHGARLWWFGRGLRR